MPVVDAAARPALALPDSMAAAALKLESASPDSPVWQAGLASDFQAANSLLIPVGLGLALVLECLDWAEALSAHLPILPEHCCSGRVLLQVRLLGSVFRPVLAAYQQASQPVSVQAGWAVPASFQEPVEQAKHPEKR